MPAHMLFGLAGSGGAQQAVSSRFIGDVVSDTVDRSVYTFSNVAFSNSTPASPRKIFLSLYVDENGANSTTSITVNGVAMTRAVGPVTNSNQYAEIWHLDVDGSFDTPLQATVVVTLAATALGALICCGTFFNLPVGAVHATATSTVDPGDLSLNVVANGAVVAFGHTSATSTSITVTGVTTASGDGIFDGVHNLAHEANLIAASPRTVTMDYSTGTTPVACAVSFN